MGNQFWPLERGTAAPPLFGPCLLWPNGWMDQNVLDKPSFSQNQMVAHLTYCRALVAQLTVRCPVTLQCGATFPPPQKLLRPLRRSDPPCHTWCLRPNWVVIPNDISIGYAVFVWLPNAILYNALSLGRKAPKIAPSLWDFITLPEEDRATAIDSMRRRIGNDRACGSSVILADIQTDTQTDR